MSIKQKKTVKEITKKEGRIQRENLGVAPLAEQGQTSSPKQKLTPKEQEELNEQLRQAAKIGNTKYIQRLAILGADVNSKDPEDWTALHYAAWNGHADACKVLKELGADINSKDNYDKTAISYAAQDGHTDACKVLKELGADINAKDKKGQTAIHLAAMDGETETCKVLLELGANPLLKNKDGKTARDVTYGYRPEIKKLLGKWENVWFVKLIGKEKVNKLLDAIKECNSERVGEIFVGL